MSPMLMQPRANATWLEEARQQALWWKRAAWAELIFLAAVVAYCWFTR